MALTVVPLPYGLRDVKIAPLAPITDVVGTFVDLPNSQTFTFAENEEFQELRGDDKVVATHGSGPTVNWTLAAGGISIDAYKILAGGAVTDTGTTPNQLRTYKKLGANARPYFQVKGQVISDSGGDLHCIVYKCKAEGEIGGEFADGAFFITGASGRGIPDGTDNLYDFLQHETAVAIP